MNSSVIWLMEKDRQYSLYFQYLGRTNILREQYDIEVVYFRRRVSVSEKLPFFTISPSATELKAISELLCHTANGNTSWVYLILAATAYSTLAVWHLWQSILGDEN